MGVFDIFLMSVILGGAFWLLYHSLWKKKGCCQGCNGEACSKR